MRRRQYGLRIACAALVLGVALPAHARAAALPRPIAAALAQAGIPDDALGLLVQPVGARRPTLEWRGDQPMNPASTMKLVTTLAGLELLGPSYRWRTEVYVDGMQTADVVQGDIVLKGYADPRLTLESLWMMLRELRARGIREIRGDLVVDRSFFSVDDDPARFDGEPTRPYNVVPDALLLNFKSVRLQFLPRPDEQRIQIFSIPELPEVEVANHLALTADACEGTPERPESATQNSLVFLGNYAVSCGERSRSFALLSPDRYALTLFKQLWAELGGQLHGTIRSGRTSPEARLLMTWQSPPMSEVIRDINKFSNNVMARQLFLTLSAEENPPGTLEKSAARVRRWLTGAGIGPDAVVLDNGAGLSRSERVSPNALARILLRGFFAPWMPEYLASLPIVGVDGTARRHLEGSPAAGHAHIKTGYLEGVRAAAGYVQDERGGWAVVVSILNHPAAGDAQGFQDTVIEWVYRGGSLSCHARGRGQRAGGACAHRGAMP